MKYCILGAAKSGIAAAILANALNNNLNTTNTSANDFVLVRELLPKEKFSDEAKLFDSLGIKYEFGAESQSIAKAEDTLPNYDCLIVSPGVPNDAPFILTANRLGIPVYSEMEFASQHINNPIIAITGTNGKTTTTTLINYIFNNSGINAVEAGNIGVPLSEIATKILKNTNANKTNSDNNITKDTVIVLEVSSYQLEFIDKFKPSIAIILNITPDHLKYHKTMENYIAAKLKIAKNQDESDILILSADDENINCKQIEEFSKKNNIKSKIYQFSLSPVNRGIYIAGDKVINFIKQTKEDIMQTREIKIPGAHNQYNSMAAMIVAKVWQLSNENIRDSLSKFNGVEHRLEFVSNINGADYINDSKATNVNATWYALNSYERPIIWLAGGRGDNDYTMLDESIAQKVKIIITFGEESENIYARYSPMLNCIKTENIFTAINEAYRVAKQNDIVLFSPACKSFDQFTNFEHRGECFKQAVHQLTAVLN